MNVLPDVFFDISETMDLKMKAMAEYKSESKVYPHPRSLEGIEQNAQLWGMKVGLKYAEAFKLVRKERDDIDKKQQLTHHEQLIKIGV